MKKHQAKHWATYTLDNRKNHTLHKKVEQNYFVGRVILVSQSKKRTVTP